MNDQTDTETPVDHLELASVMLRDAEIELQLADLSNMSRTMLALTIGALQDQIDVLR